ncbi:MAG: hypothetical protein WBU92_08755 [Candidatus Dormiibacterota bacterium]
MEGLGARHFAVVGLLERLAAALLLEAAATTVAAWAWAGLRRPYLWIPLVLALAAAQAVAMQLLARLGKTWAGRLAQARSLSPGRAVAPPVESWLWPGVLFGLILAALAGIAAAIMPATIAVAPMEAAAWGLHLAAEARRLRRCEREHRARLVFTSRLGFLAPDGIEFLALGEGAPNS